MQIKFTQDYIKRDGKQSTPDATVYRKGKVYEVKPDTAEHYVRRGIAEVVSFPDPLTPPTGGPTGGGDPVLSSRQGRARASRSRSSKAAASKA